MKLLLCFLTFFLAAQAQARVFHFGMETVAAYIHARGGTSSIGTDSYSWQTPVSYTGATTDLHFGGGFGGYWRMGSLGIQLGAIVDTTDKIESARGYNASGAELYSVDSESIVYGGLFAVTLNFAKMKTSMWNITLGGGYQVAKIQNTYTATAAGQVAGMNTATETFKNEQPFALASVGYEFLLSGVTTMTLSAGYHYTLGSTWSYGEGGSNFAGAHTQGGNVVLENGSDKTIDWNYPYLEVTFRFYIDKVR